MYRVLDKDIIEMGIVPYSPSTKRSFKPRSPLHEIVNAILYRLKKGVPWEYLPIEGLFDKRSLHYKTIYDHYLNQLERF